VHNVRFYFCLFSEVLSAWLSDWLIGWLISCLIGWLFNWFIDWVIDWLIDWLIVCDEYWNGSSLSLLICLGYNHEFSRYVLQCSLFSLYFIALMNWSCMHIHMIQEITGWHFWTMLYNSRTWMCSIRCSIVLLLLKMYSIVSLSCRTLQEHFTQSNYISYFIYDCWQCIYLFVFCSGLIAASLLFLYFCSLLFCALD